MITKPVCRFFHGIADQGRAQDVHPQERQQDREPRAAVDVLLHRPAAVPRLEERRVGQGRRQRGQARSPPASATPGSDRSRRHPREPIDQGWRRRAFRRTRRRRRRRGNLLGGCRHMFAPTRRGGSRGRNRGGNRFRVTWRHQLVITVILVGRQPMDQTLGTPVATLAGNAR